MYTLICCSEQTNFLIYRFYGMYQTDSSASSDQSNVISAAVDGAIDTVLIKTAGSGGTNGTHTGVAIRGDGSSGECCKCHRSRWCCYSSYSYNCWFRLYFCYNVRNADIVAAGATSLSGAELDVIIPPKGGHGANAVEELGGFFVMCEHNL